MLIDSNFCYEGRIQLLPSGLRINVVYSPWMSIVSELQLAEGLTSMASFSTVVDGFPAPRFIIPDLNVVMCVCDYLLEGSTHQLIVPSLLCSFVYLYRPDYSS